MDARTQLVGQLLRILVLAFSLWVAIEALDVRGPDPEVPRHVLNEPTEHELEPPGAVTLPVADPGRHRPASVDPGRSVSAPTEVSPWLRA
jgi:hypothetical protein